MFRLVDLKIFVAHVSLTSVFVIFNGLVDIEKKGCCHKILSLQNQPALKRYEEYHS